MCLSNGINLRRYNTGATSHATGSVVAKLSPLTKTIPLNGSPRGGGAGGAGVKAGAGAGAAGGSGNGPATSTAITSPSSTHKAKRPKGLF